MTVGGFGPALGVAAMLVAGCAAPATSFGTGGAAALRAKSSGNIYWNKASLALRYPAHGHRDAVLTFWAPDGYFTEGVYCKNKGKVAASAHRQWGDPSGNEHAVYWFTAKTAGPNECGFSAVLNGTGSPPIAVLKLPIK